MRGNDHCGVRSSATNTIAVMETAPASRRRGFHSQLIQSTPETIGRPTGPDTLPLQQEYPRQTQARRPQSAQKSDPSVWFEYTSRDPLGNGRVKAHRNVA